MGRPQFGPGALANPGRRLGARLLDGLIFLPILAFLMTVTLLIAAPHFGPILPKVTTYVDGTSTSSSTPPGLLWLYLTVVVVVFVNGLLFVAYETIATARFGRTLGKRWLGIRPLRRDGAPVGYGRALGRSAIQWLFGFLSWFGAIDPLFCTWDDQRQCLHDKVADTIVVND